MDGHSRSESTHERKAHHSRGHQTEQDTQAAHAAWDAWKSDNPEAWDWALDQKEKILKKDPKAWSRAMKEVDAEEAAQKRASEQKEREEQQRRQAELRAQMEAEAQQKAAAERLRADSVDPRTMVIPEADYAPRAADNLHSGYAPQSSFAPEPPHSPAYDAAYNRPQGEFHGVDLGIVKLGVRDGSLETGVNVGVARTDLTLGKNTGVNAEFMPYDGPLHARTNANIGFEDGGIHSEVGAGANFFNVVNGDADFGARLGKHTGVNGDVRGKVWPVNVQADAGADVGPAGMDAYTGANTGIADAFGVRSGAHIDVGQNSSAGAGVGLKFGEKTLDFGPSIDIYGNRAIRPNLNFRPVDSDESTFYPTGNRDIDP